MITLLIWMIIGIALSICFVFLSDIIEDRRLKIKIQDETRLNDNIRLFTCQLTEKNKIWNKDYVSDNVDEHIFSYPDFDKISGYEYFQFQIGFRAWRKDKQLKEKVEKLKSKITPNNYRDAAC